MDLPNKTIHHKLIWLRDKSGFILFHTVCNYVFEKYISEYVHIPLQFGIMSQGN